MSAYWPKLVAKATMDETEVSPPRHAYLDGNSHWVNTTLVRQSFVEGVGVRLLEAEY